MSHFITQTRNFSEVTILPADTKKSWSEATLNEIKKLINNKTFLMDDQEKGYPVKPYMHVYKAEIQSDVSIEKLKLRIVVRGDLKNK